MFLHSQGDFAEVDSVSGTIPGEPGVGLGPSFNLNSCAGCHKFPAVGGSSPAVNPQVALATQYGANNTVPSFITVNGPVREVRFKADGGVHDLFTIKGLPPGTYKVEAWHEKYGTKDMDITVAPKDTKTVDFEFKG